MNSERIIYFEPAGQILSSHRSYFENPPNGYRFMVNEDNIGACFHRLLNTSLYKFGLGSFPWHVIKPKMEKYTSKLPVKPFLTFAWNHVVFRDEPWIMHTVI